MNAYYLIGPDDQLLRNGMFVEHTYDFFPYEHRGLISGRAGTTFVTVSYSYNVSERGMLSGLTAGDKIKFTNSKIEVMN